ncbi:MAG TPA: sugar phosphorylase [Geopsychrobacteraceae bacterium]|nr:sugar phosphorylase [Geopsychrobacteraceae bacterium]
MCYRIEDSRLKLFRQQMTCRLETLYGAELSTSVAEQIIEELLQYGMVSEPVSCRLWNQNDVILITYGDSVVEEGVAPLHTLQKFLNEQLPGLISTVHILPFFPYSSDDGFSVIDYYQVDPKLGDWDDVNAISERFDLMVDLVINHVSSESQWFKDYVAQRAPASDYFITADPLLDNSQVIRPRQSPLLTPVETASGLRYVWTTFSADQVDLNFSNPQVLLEFVRILLFYLRQKSRFIRLDAIAFLWKEIGTPCINLPQTHEVVKLLRELMEVASPHSVLLTETNLPPLQNRSYFGDSDEAHMVYQFSLAPLLLHGLFRGTSHYLYAWARRSCISPPGCTFLNFTASHDGVGLRPLEGLLPDAELALLLNGMQQFGGLVSSRTKPDGSESPYEINIGYFDALSGTWLGTDCWQVARFLLAQTLMLGLRGIPALYIHSLLATPNDYQGVEETGHARAINRRSLLFDELNDQLSAGNSPQKRVFDALCHRLKIRQQQAAFHPDARQEVIPVGDALFAFWRYSQDGSQRLLAVHNMTDLTQTLYFDGSLDGQLSGDWFELLDQVELKSSTSLLQLAPYQVLWFSQTVV